MNYSLEISLTTHFTCRGCKSSLALPAPSTSGRREWDRPLFYLLIKIDLGEDDNRLSPEANHVHVFEVNSERFEPILFNVSEGSIQSANVQCHEGYVRALVDTVAQNLSFITSTW